MSIFTDITLYHYLTVATILFLLGAFGVMTGRNLIRTLICVELMLNAVNINLVAFNNYLHRDTMSGQIFAIFILVVSAAEAAVGLALVIAMFRLKRTVDMEAFNQLHG